MKVLLVEDNLLNQKFAETILKKVGYEIDIAENGLIGFEMYCKKRYDIVLMDIQMPVMDGVESTLKIRKWEQQKRLKPVPVVAVTAYALENDVERYLGAGINAYLRKPYQPKDLVELVQQFTSG
jgi:CheY-like chemotaxis protein